MSLCGVNWKSEVTVKAVWRRCFYSAAGGVRISPAQAQWVARTPSDEKPYIPRGAIAETAIRLYD